MAGSVFQGPWMNQGPQSEPESGGPQDFGQGSYSMPGFADPVGMHQARQQGAAAESYGPQSQSLPPQPQTNVQQGAFQLPTQNGQPLTVGTLANGLWGQAKQMPWWVWLGLGVGGTILYYQYKPKAKGWALAKLFGSAPAGS